MKNFLLGCLCLSDLLHFRWIRFGEFLVDRHRNHRILRFGHGDLALEDQSLAAGEASEMESMSSWWGFETDAG